MQITLASPMSSSSRFHSVGRRRRRRRRRRVHVTLSPSVSATFASHRYGMAVESRAFRDNAQFIPLQRRAEVYRVFEGMRIATVYMGLGGEVAIEEI